MNQPVPVIVVATFANRSDARACFEALQDQGFEKPWMAETMPADGQDLGDAFATTAPSNNEIAQTSDGPIASVGRFFNGQGNSLRRALEEHGIAATSAERIDGMLTAPSAVVVTTVGSRAELAVRIIEQARGSVEN